MISQGANHNSCSCFDSLVISGLVASTQREQSIEENDNDTELNIGTIAVQKRVLLHSRK